MRTRSLMISALVAVVAGCASGTQQPLTPSTDGFSALRTRAAVQESVLHGFTGSPNDGSAPISQLTKAGKDFYGVTGAGGANGNGTVFAISMTGKQFKVIYDFKKRDGSPSSTAGLTNVRGTLYGVTTDGGAYGKGTVFKITPAGAFQTMYSFKGGKSDGAIPAGGLTAVGLTLYGTTSSGGVGGGGSCLNCGTAFAISTGGQEKVIYVFGANASDGTDPRSTMVVLGGVLYGTTTSGGNGGGASVTAPCSR